MAAPFRNVALIGATGNLGSKIFGSLSKAGFHVTVVQRDTSDNTPPASTHVVRANLLNKTELAAAFMGQDVVVSAVPNPVATEQKIMLDAAIEAGVTRVVPSEFSSNLEAKAKEDKLPIVREKLEFREMIEQAAASGRITWSSINNGPFLDGGVKWGIFGPNMYKKQAVYHDGGDKVVCATSTDDVAKAVALMLQHPVETMNKPVYIYSAAFTEKKMCDIVTKITGTQLTPVHVDIQEEYKKSLEAVEAGKVDIRSSFGLYYLMMYGPGYGGDYTDMAMNEVIGLRVMDDTELEANITQWLA